MARPLARDEHPVTGQTISRCSKHFWVRIRQGGGCWVCARQARKRVKRLIKKKRIPSR